MSSEIIDILKNMKNEIESKKQNIDFSVQNTLVEKKIKPIKHEEKKKIQQKVFQKSNYELKSFLGLENEAFVKKVYNALLLREADKKGLNHYVSQLKSKKLSKIEVLGHIRYSKEGRKNNVKVLGLLPRFLILKVDKIPIVGYIVNLLIALFNLPKILKALVNKDEEIAKLHYKYNILQTKVNQVEKVKEDVTKLQTKVNQVEQEIYG